MTNAYPSHSGYLSWVFRNPKLKRRRSNPIPRSTRSGRRYASCKTENGSFFCCVIVCDVARPFHLPARSNQPNAALSRCVRSSIQTSWSKSSAIMGVTPKIAPSMLSSDFANLASEAARMLNDGADWLHMDIMDGHFVPNLTIGAPVIESLRKHTKAYLDCHLMVTNPLDYVEHLRKAGASGFTFHIETSKDNWPELVQRIKSGGMTPGVALRPGTPVEEIYPLVEAENPVELVLVMTVEPGFGGQKFMPEMMDKVRVLRQKYPSLNIEVDGGLGPSTIDTAASAGANCIVAGSSVFGAPEPAQVISLLRKSIEKAQQTS